MDAEGNYKNDFVAIPHLARVPPINPHYLPPHGSPELAEVIDDADPKQLGRLRVRYYWPVARPQDAETDWLRVLTPYSGQGKGYLMKPEVGSQVLVAYQGSLAEQPFVLGNLFHAKNPQGATYSPAQNNLKGIQTAGGNKVVMQEAKGAQSILISNSNNKGTAIQVSFAGDGSITIKSNGPVTVLSPTITLEAGDKGEIKLHAKTIALEAEDHITQSAKKTITTKAKNITTEATNKVETKATRKTITTSQTLEVNGGASVDIKAALVKINS